MPRPVRFFDLFWSDRDFRKTLKGLSEQDREQRLKELAELVEALAACTHPTHDPILAGWRPSAYHVRKMTPDIKLFEYRCRQLFRVIARWIEPCEEDPEGAILMVAATLSHDHERLKEVIFRNREDLG